MHTPERSQTRYPSRIPRDRVRLHWLDASVPYDARILPCATGGARDAILAFHPFNVDFKM
jgi:hypothetical protein